MHASRTHMYTRLGLTKGQRVINLVGIVKGLKINPVDAAHPPYPGYLS